MALFFYLFATLMVISSILVIISKNSVYSVLWLIFTFCNAAGLMILLGAEFLAMMLIIIYVGAVAVLFLFVVMMLEVNLIELKEDLKKKLPISLFVAFILFADLVIIILLGTKSINLDIKGEVVIPESITNVHAIGEVLYTDFILPFQTAGIILFVAMIACISLTLRTRPGVKRQNIHKQLKKNKSNSLKVLKMPINEGIQNIEYDD